MSKLYVVGTPIGNLEDFSPRAVRILSECDFIAAEDTRVTLKLLNHFGIKKQMVSYYEHNRNESGEKIIADILSGKKGPSLPDLSGYPRHSPAITRIKTLIITKRTTTGPFFPIPVRTSKSTVDRQFLHPFSK